MNPRSAKRPSPAATQTQATQVEDVRVMSVKDLPRRVVRAPVVEDQPPFSLESLRNRLSGAQIFSLSETSPVPVLNPQEEGDTLSPPLEAEPEEEDLFGEGIITGEW